MEGVEAVSEHTASVLIIGFGRVGQIASQGVLARGATLTIIDNNTQMIRDAQAYGFKVYYGDGSREDVLHAAGAHTASAILVCIDDKAAATRIAEIAKEVCPQARVLVRAFDREHAVALAKAGADCFVRETFESAMVLGRQAVLATGASEEEADEVMERVRRRDAERFDLEVAGGLFAGRALVLGNLAKRDSAQGEAAAAAH
jgi:glutathione-regulated potassium-efflux system protein KefB